jgi:ABC-type Na+ efflux pump permease subunit
VIDLGRTWAVARKEFREFRRNRFILVTMVSGAFAFEVVPVITVLRGLRPGADPAAVSAVVGTTLLMMLIVPIILPATIAAYSVIGEREQGTLEAVLTTPVRREELLLGKAFATWAPAVALAYSMYAIFMVIVRVGATGPIERGIWRWSWLVTELLFVPLLAGWSVWVCTAISARSNDVRVAQQLGTLASLPALGIVSLMTYGVLSASVTVALVIAAVLLAFNVVAYRIVSAMFDRERLVVGRPAHRR